MRKEYEMTSFETWWKEYLSRFPKRWTSGNEIADELVKYLALSDGPNREAILEGLTNIILDKGYAWWIAAHALINSASTINRRFIVNHLRRQGMLNSHDTLSQEFIGNVKCDSVAERYKERQWSVALLQILAGESSHEFVNIVEQYLNAPFVEDQYIAVCWALWKHHPNLAVTGWVRFFTFDPSRPTSHSILVQAFQKETEALGLLKHALINQSKETWQQFSDTILAPDMVGWLKNHELEQLQTIISES